MRQDKHELTETNSLRKYGLRFTAQGALALLVVSLFIISSCNGGESVASPTQNNSCQQVGGLTCITTSASRGWTCCNNFFNANASTGYLCVQGLDSFRGCYNSLGQARSSGPQCTTVVRCTF